MEALLKASEASALMGVSMRHVRRMAQSGALSYQIHMNAQNRPEYLFPLSSLQNRVKALESEVKAYVDLHRAELDGKSRALNFGTVGYRVSSKLMLASSRVAEAIATLKVLGHAELIKTTETLDREALKRQPGDILQQVGAYIRTVDEFYYDVSSKEADA